LEINRSTLYYKANDNDEDVWLLNIIRDIWLRYTFFGYRKITVMIRNEHNIIVNKKRVQRLMQVSGICAVYPKPNTSKANKEHAVYPYLLRNLVIATINHVWMTDITYLKLNGKFVYLVALIDVYSRFIVGWYLSFELDTESCLHALNIAVKTYGKPIIINSDQGCQFTSHTWISMLIDFEINISMDGIGRCIDNIYIERFWRTIKYEAIYLNEYNNYNELYCGARDYINFYNTIRPHQSLGYKTPHAIYYGE